MLRFSARRLGAVLCLLPLLAACGGAPSAAEMPGAPPSPGPVAGAEMAPVAQAPGAPVPAAGGIADAPATGPAGQPGGNTNAKTAPAERAKAPQALVVFTGELGVLVSDGSVASALDQAVLVAEDEGGHLAGRGNDFVKVKVPSSRFREAMSKIEKVGEVTNRSVTADDVTAEFKDLEVRLENLKATRKRIEELMGRAGNLTELFVVEKELERVTTEIDVIQGRLRFLRDSTSFSVITIRAAAKPKPVVAKDPEKAPPAPPPPARTIDLPVGWLGGLGIDELLRL
jgi:hypothetical protein